MDLRFPGTLPFLAAILFQARSTAILTSAALGLGLPWLAVVVVDMFRRGRNNSWQKAALFGPILAIVERPRQTGWITTCFALVAAWIDMPAVFALVATASSCAVGLAIGCLATSQSRSRNIAAFIAWTGTAWAMSAWCDLTLLPDSVAVAVGLLMVAAVYFVLASCDPLGDNEADAFIIALLLGWALAQVELPLALRATCVLFPLGMYVVYCERIRGGLNAFKASMRGAAAAEAGDAVGALQQWAVALRFSPRSKSVQERYWQAHRAIDLDLQATDNRLAHAVDIDFCLHFVERSLDGLPEKPKLELVCHLIELVRRRAPDRNFAVLRLAAMANLADGKVSDAICGLAPIRSAELFINNQTEVARIDLAKCWLLAIRDARLAAAGTLSWLEGPGLLHALRALSAADGLEPVTNDALTFLYRRIGPRALVEYREWSHGDDLQWLSLERLTETARQLWSEGDAATGLNALAAAAELAPRPILYWRLLADWELSRSPTESTNAKATAWLHRIRAAATSADSESLDKLEWQAFAQSCRQLATAALADNDFAEAIANLELLVAHRLAGEAALRQLFGLYKANHDILNGIRIIESALAFSLNDKQEEFWNDAKRRNYCRLDAGQVAALPRDRRQFLDYSLCLANARRLFESAASRKDLERQLALAELGPRDQAVEAMLLRGKLALRESDWNAAARSFEEALAGNAATTARLEAARLLANIYLNRLGNYAAAVPLLLELERSPSSGASTLFDLARAYDGMGDVQKAKHWYDMVLVYPTHPLAKEAKKAIARLGGNVA